MLRYTSCLFGIVVINAYHHTNAGSFRVTCYHHFFLLVMVLSILYHCTHDRRIALADKVWAHAVFLFVIISDSWKAMESGETWLFIFPFAVVCLWLGETLWPARSEVLHVCLHIISVLGVSCYLQVLN